MGTCRALYAQHLNGDEPFWLVSSRIGRKSDSFRVYCGMYKGAEHPSCPPKRLTGLSPACCPGPARAVSAWAACLAPGIEMALHALSVPCQRHCREGSACVLHTGGHVVCLIPWGKEPLVCQFLSRESQHEQNLITSPRLWAGAVYSLFSLFVSKPRTGLSASLGNREWHRTLCFPLCKSHHKVFSMFLIFLAVVISRLF